MFWSLGTNRSKFYTFDTFSQISKNTFCSQNDHINDLELSLSAPAAGFRCGAFPIVKKTMIFMIFNDLNNFDNFMVLGPRPLGPMGPFIPLTSFSYRGSYGFVKDPLKPWRLPAWVPPEQKPIKMQSLLMSPSKTPRKMEI